MAPTKTSKVKSSSSKNPTRKKKLTTFNKFMQTELMRLKEDEPDMAHKERFKLATANWKLSAEAKAAKAKAAKAKASKKAKSG